MTAQSLSRRLAACSSGAAFALGLSTLIGWACAAETLQSVVPGLMAMNPVTAVALLAAACSLWLQLPQGASVARRRAGRWLAAAVAACGLLRLAEYTFGRPAGVDRWLFADVLGGNLMAPNTAVSFVLLGLGLAGLDAAPRPRRAAAAAIYLVAAVALLSLVGHAFGARPLYGFPSFAPMALNTSVALMALALAALAARPDRGLAALLCVNAPRGAIARRLVPAAIAAPVLLGWLRLKGERAGLYDTAFGTALLISAIVLSLIGVIWWAALALDRADRARGAADEAVRRANEELELRVRERTVELIAANRDLRQKNRENETFVYGVSHDLRAPLVNLEGFSKELAETSGELRQVLTHSGVSADARARGLALLDGDVAESLHFIRRGVERLANIVDSLLRLSRAGRVEHQPQRVEPGPICERVVESLNGTIAACGARVTIGDLPALWVDPASFEQIVANLIGNGLKYLDPERPGRIEVSACESGDLGRDPGAGLAVLCVRDNGLGIPQAFRDKVFQPFQRAHTHVEGDGMGLAIVRRLVERQGGAVWVESEVDRGSTFFVEFPAAARGERRHPESRREREGESHEPRALAHSAG